MSDYYLYNVCVVVVRCGKEEPAPDGFRTSRMTCVAAQQRSGPGIAGAVELVLPTPARTRSLRAYSLRTTRPGTGQRRVSMGVISARTPPGREQVGRGRGCRHGTADPGACSAYGAGCPGPRPPRRAALVSEQARHRAGGPGAGFGLGLAHCPTAPLRQHRNTATPQHRRICKPPSTR